MSDLSQVLKLNTPDRPFGTLKVLGHRANSRGTVVDLDVQLSKTDAQKAQENDFFAELGIL